MLNREITSKDDAKSDGSDVDAIECPFRSIRKVFYFVDPSVTGVSLGDDHPMRPVRLRLLHSLVAALGLDRHTGGVEVFEAPPASVAELLEFHPPEYVHFLRSASLLAATTGGPTSAAAGSQPAALLSQSPPLGSFCGCSPVPTAAAEATAKALVAEFGDAANDCPLFSKMWDVVRSYCGASLACARALCGRRADIAINWSGGMHHAAASRCSGFCYANDVALCILELLKAFQRVLYIDLDVHHGDGVEEAFRCNQRVLTLSIHQFGDSFFPGTGALEPSPGQPPGFSGGSTYVDGAATSSLAAVGVCDTRRAFVLNIPLPARTGDDVYVPLFLHAMVAAVRAFAPEAIVLQCGADTIYGDALGGLCVSTVGHAACVEAVLALELPTVMLGGGGYNVLHTARCWAVHTAVAVGRHRSLPAYLPPHDTNHSHHVQHQQAAVGGSLGGPPLHVLPPAGAALPKPRLAAFARRCVGVLAAQLRPVLLLRASFTRYVALVRAVDAARQLAESEARRKQRGPAAAVAEAGAVDNAGTDQPRNQAEDHGTTEGFPPTKKMRFDES